MDLRYGSDQDVLITGGTEGIGDATAHAFAAEGVGRIHVVGRKPVPTWIFAGSEIVSHAVDLSTADGRAQIADLASRVSILVNNAGDIPHGGIEHADLAAWWAAWELKMLGYVALAKAALAGQATAVVNIIGVAGERPDARYVAGSMANAALMAMVRALGAYSLDRGKRVVGVNPGAVDTKRVVRAMRQRAAEEFGDPERWTEYLRRLPGGRMTTPNEVADTVVFLASPRSRRTTGTIVTVDGGEGSRGGII
jgi:NAD(P)-dependent dehydrogenase (short-subunit alcohol dehydrogenase family)